MANEEHIKILNKGFKYWNEWKLENPALNPDLTDTDLSNMDLTNYDLTFVDFTGTNLQYSNLSSCNISHAILNNVNLANSNLSYAVFLRAYLINANIQSSNLKHSDFSQATLPGADIGACNCTYAFFNSANLAKCNISGCLLHVTAFYKANLSYADFRESRLNGVNFVEANLYRANLNGAELDGVNLEKASLVETKIDKTNFKNCFVYGISVWGLIGNPASQSNFQIMPLSEVAANLDNSHGMTVEDIMLAQFIYLLMNNDNVRNIIDTVTTKVVLILGRFSDGRIVVLEAIKKRLLEMNLTPILFDFNPSTNKDVTGTVETIARMARFIIADLTDPISIPHELATIIPFMRTTPIQPIKLKGSRTYSMFDDYQKAYPWVLEVYEYDNINSLVISLEKVISPANEMVEKIRNSS